MAVSILHRITGDGLAIAGTLMLLWWLGALAGGEAAYKHFIECVWAKSATGPLTVSNWIGRIVLIGLSWAFFQHMLSGLRHLVLDIGAGFELKSNRMWSIVVLVGGVILTAAFWLFIFARNL